MSNTQLSSWGKWQQTRNTLSQTLALNSAKRLETAPGSSEEAELDKNIQQNLTDMQAHALNGLRSVNMAIAEKKLVEKIALESEEAKKEADRIKTASATVKDLTDLTGKLTKVVKLFPGL
jgi:hypothetical protein